MFPETQDLSGTHLQGTVSTDLGKSYMFDFFTGDFVVQNGKLVETKDITVWIEKILRTEKKRFKIYEDTKYGCQIEDLLIGNNYPIAFIESELKREIEVALLQHPKIAAISKFALERGTKSITISLEVEMNDAGTNTVTVTL